MKHLLVSMISEADRLISKRTELNECNLQLEEMQELKSELAELLCKMQDVVNEKDLTQEEEIYCFKEAKPYILGRMMFIKQVSILKATDDIKSQNLQRTLYLRKQEYIDNKIFDNIELYRYYKSKSEKLDAYYFTRENRDFYNDWREVAFDRNPLFATSHDLDIANFICYELLSEYLSRQLERMDREFDIFEDDESFDMLPEMKWTDKKSDMVELCYAIHSKGSINNGLVPIKDIISKMGRIFSVDVENYYQIYGTFKGRKKERLPYLSALNSSLNRKMDCEDSEV